MNMKEQSDKLNELLVTVFNTILKVEEVSLKKEDGGRLSITEIHTLEAIDTDCPQTMTAVAGKLKVSMSTLTIAVNKLVDKGYVSRCRIEEDRRIVKVWLTDKGQKTVTKHRKFHDAMVKDVIKGLSEEELNVLVESLEKLKRFFHKTHESAASGGKYESD